MAPKRSEAFKRVLSGLQDALAYERGERRDLTIRDVEIAPPAPMGPPELGRDARGRHAAPP
jgi:hypothetical protein